MAPVWRGACHNLRRGPCHSVAIANPRSKEAPLSLEGLRRLESRARRGRAVISALATVAAFVSSLTFAPTASAAVTTVGFVVTDTRSNYDRALKLKFLGVEVRNVTLLGFEETNANGRPTLPEVGATLPGPDRGHRFELIEPSLAVGYNYGYAVYGVYKSDNETLVRTFVIEMRVQNFYLTFGIPHRLATCEGFVCSVQYKPGTVYIDVTQTL
jgi:hypothetical protein